MVSSEDSTAAYAPVPVDSRYVPLVQQPYCCTPASILIVMQKLGLPPVSQEELGYHLGLTVPPDKADLFWHVRVSDEPPTAAGYGTQIQKPEFNPNHAFKALGIPLRFVYNLIDNFETADKVRAYLQNVQQADGHSLVCFRYGTLYDTGSTAGHTSVFDHYVAQTDTVRLIDPVEHVPKWRTVPLQKLFQAMVDHTPDNSGGFWEISYL